MALTYTPAGELGTSTPEFTLPTVDGKKVALRDFAAQPVLLVMFLCNHCPYVKAIEDRLIHLGAELNKKNVAVVAICSNDPSEYPEDAPAALLQRWREKNYGFPYLIDQSQSVARAFSAVCTPDFFVYDSNRSLRYRGRLDDSWRNPEQVRSQELKQAVEALLAGKSPIEPQNPSLGCSIKWRNRD